MNDDRMNLDPLGLGPAELEKQRSGVIVEIPELNLGRLCPGACPFNRHEGCELGLAEYENETSLLRVPGPRCPRSGKYKLVRVEEPDGESENSFLPELIERTLNDVVKAAELEFPFDESPPECAGETHAYEVQVAHITSPPGAEPMSRKEMDELARSQGLRAELSEDGLTARLYARVVVSKRLIQTFGRRVYPDGKYGRFYF